MHRATWMLAALAACVLAGCERPPGDANTPTTQPGAALDEVKQKAQAAATAAADYVQRKHTEFMERMQPQLEQLERRYEEVKERLRDAAREAQPEVEKRLEDLRQGVREARERLDRVAGAGGAAWEDAKEGLENAMEELREALENVPPATQPVEPDGGESEPARE